MAGERAVIDVILAKPEWRVYQAWYINFDTHVNMQDRDKLDAVLPDSLVQEVLGLSEQKLFLFEGWLRSRRFCDEDIELSVLEAFEQFGLNAIDDAFEKGSAKVN